MIDGKVSLILNMSIPILKKKRHYEAYDVVERQYHIVSLLWSPIRILTPSDDLTFNERLFYNTADNRINIRALACCEKEIYSEMINMSSYMPMFIDFILFL